MTQVSNAGLTLSETFMRAWFGLGAGLVRAWLGILIRLFTRPLTKPVTKLLTKLLPKLLKSMVRTGRLELPHLSILEPKSSASTNSATSAALKHEQYVLG
jgi:hypothetical protein